MKKYISLLSVGVVSATLLLVGCDDKKTTTAENSANANQDSKSETAKASTNLTVGVINSYLFHTEPELLPNSKLIKQQHIQGSSDKVINYNTQGYVANYDLEGLHAEINYDTAKYIYGMKETRNDYDITFDATKNIVGMKNSNGDIVASSEFDEQGRLAEMTLSHFADNNVIFHNQIIYDQDQVDQILSNAYVPVDEKTKFPILVQEKNIIYNSNKQLEKTITTTFKLTSNGEIIINNKNEKEVESSETCTYSDYNENNDWTKAVCVTTGDESKTVNLTRTIQYE
ncbi:hypothetical protein [Gilliamella sp. wkB112]|uniref:hypothetical protein n=1 Tax=Gilliamella sp. wkB112 TaxID=3120257 RepID=UPI00080E2985|nr:hypothetical protein [Gilliamella apicola]OCG02117.1 hypothetical protein A9G12_10355 [Gilliamella apicola]